jgi:HAD superfamily hydrolase (TIGR01490 family)
VPRRSRGGPARAAIFDLDNTLVRGSSLFHFGVMLARRRVVPWHQVLRHAGTEAAYVLRRREPDCAALVAERVLGAAEGMPQGRILDLAEEFASERLRVHLVPEVHLQVRDLRQAGYLTVVATASPQELASAVASQLRMDAAIGTEAEVSAGRYTGRLAGPLCHGPEKARRVRQFLQERGIDPDDCLAFSDSANDVPLLGLVGQPVATNPDRELQQIARTNGWWILRSSPVADAYPETSPPIYPHPY